MSSKEMYSFISCNCSSVGSPSVVLVKGKLSVQGFEGCQAPWSPTLLNGSCYCGPSSRSACIKGVLL